MMRAAIDRSGGTMQQHFFLVENRRCTCKRKWRGKVRARHGMGHGMRAAYTEQATRLAGAIIQKGRGRKERAA